MKRSFDVGHNRRRALFRERALDDRLDFGSYPQQIDRAKHVELKPRSVSRSFFVKLPCRRSVIGLRRRFNVRIRDRRMSVGMELNYDRVDRREIGRRQLPLLGHIFRLKSQSIAFLIGRY